VRFLHSSLHILCFDICIDWQKKTNDKTQLSASFPWGMQNCKQKPKKQKKTTLCLRHSGPVGLLGFLGFLVFCLLLFFLFFLVLLTFDLLEVL